MKTIYLIIVFFVIAVSSCKKQSEPLSLAEAIFSSNGLPNLEQYITGEYDGHPNGTDFPEDVTRKFLLLAEDENTAVASITVIDSSENVFDGYLHFVKKENWQVTAFRSFAMTGMLEGALEELENLTQEEIDLLIEESKKENAKYSLFASREEYEFALGNLQLTLSSDQELIQHFQKNKKGFNEIKNKILTEIQTMKIPGEISQSVGEKYEFEMRKIYISSASIGGLDFGECINFNIGGMIDNSVGYLYVKDEMNLPIMSPNRIIMLREIENGWYIYKTT